MADSRTASLSVLFSDTTGLSGSGSGLVLEGSSRQPEREDEKFFRVYGFNEHDLTSTSGSISRKESGLRRFTSQFLYFQNSRFQALTYPGAQEVQIRKMGVITDTDGEVVDLKFTYNAQLNGVVVGANVYGVVLVEYEAPFQLWRARFSGTCPTVERDDPEALTDGGNPDDDLPYVGRDPMVIYARKEGQIKASLALDPPPCQYEDEFFGGITILDRDGGEIPRLLLEEDDIFPIRLSRGSASNPEAKGKMRIYPNDSEVNVNATAGEVSNFSEGRTRVVRERLSFNGTGSISLRYPPANNSIRVELQGSNFVDKFGRSKSPSFRVWGDVVTSVVWVDKYTVTDPQERTVNRGEVVAVNLIGNVIQCYGAVEVEYTTNYRLFDYIMEWDEDDKNFKEASLVAVLGQATATYQVRRPRTRGDY